MQQLERVMSTGTMAASAVALGPALMLLGAVPLFVAAPVLVRIVGVAFLIAGALLSWSGVMQLLARATPETIVRMDLPLSAGKTMHFIVEQPGPVAIRTLRVNLVSGRETLNVLHHGAIEIGAMPLVLETYFDVPEEFDATDWKVEVWGRVRGRANFMHALEAPEQGPGASDEET